MIKTLVLVFFTNIGFSQVLTFDLKVTRVPIIHGEPPNTTKERVRLIFDGKENFGVITERDTFALVFRYIVLNANNTFHDRVYEDVISGVTYRTLLVGDRRTGRFTLFLTPLTPSRKRMYSLILSTP